MTDEKHKSSDQQEPKTLKDEDIITERRLGRRSFLNSAGALLLGAATIAVGSRSRGAEKASSATKDTDDKDKKTDAKDTDENRMADRHLTDNKNSDANDSGDFDPDSDFRKWANKKDTD